MKAGPTMEGLHEHLFGAIERLVSAKDGPELDAEILRAQAVGNLARVLVDTAKVEVARERNLKRVGDSRFLPAVAKQLPGGGHEG